MCFSTLNSFFVNHINSTVLKALKTYGFIYRKSRDFINESSLKMLFEYLVMSRFQYRCNIWYPIYNRLIRHTEAVQKIYLKYINFLKDFDNNILLNNYHTLFLTRRKVAILKFQVGLLRNTFLLSKFSFYVQYSNSRSVGLFYHPLYNTKLLKKAPNTTISDIVNGIYGDVFYDYLATINIYLDVRNHYLLYYFYYY